MTNAVVVLSATKGYRDRLRCDCAPVPLLADGRRSTVDDDDDEEWVVTTSCGEIEWESRESCSLTRSTTITLTSTSDDDNTKSSEQNTLSILPKKGSESLDSARLGLARLDSAFSSPASSPVVQNLFTQEDGHMDDNGERSLDWTRWTSTETRLSLSSSSSSPSS